jgi:hypothetical protein
MIRETPYRTLLIVLIVIFLGLVFLLVFIFWDWLRGSIVLPVMYMYWLMSRIANSIDQQILWGGLIILAIYLMAQIFFLRTRIKIHPEEDQSTPSQGRVKYWLVYTNLMMSGVYNRSYFSEELKRLILAVLSERERLLPQEVEKKILQGDIAVPPQVLSIFAQRRTYPPASLPQKAYRTIEALIKPELRPNRPEKLENIRIVIAFLEEQVEKR